jgi:hypothetical protein
MKSPSNTEQELRNETAPWPDTIAELNEYIESLTSKELDYGMAVYAMSLSAVATFQHVAKKIGVTGWQASCADLDFLRRTRSMKCPFLIIKADDMVYPQYDLHRTLDETLHEWQSWAAEEAKRLLATDMTHTAPHVRAHWEKLASYKKPEAPTV